MTSPAGGHQDQVRVDSAAVGATAADDKLPSSFVAAMLAKLTQPDKLITELRRPEVAAEILLLAAPIGMTWAVRRRAWQSRQLYCTLNVSLNSFCPKSRRFGFRTVREEPVLSVLPQGGAEQLTDAAQRATAEQNFIVPLERGDRFIVNNAVMSAVSQQFAAAALKRDILGPAGDAAVHCEPYVLVLTAEPLGVARMGKVRAMLARRGALLALAGEVQERPRVKLASQASPNDADSLSRIVLEEHWHVDRYILMRKLARRWLLDVELTDKENDALPYLTQQYAVRIS